MRLNGRFGAGPQPHVVVDPRGRRLVREVRDRRQPVHVRPRAHRPDASQLAGVDEVDRLGPVRAAALPLADLHDAVVALRRRHHQVALFDGVGQRLLAVDVLARLARLDHLQAVPVVRGADDHRVEVGVLEQRTVVAVHLRRDRGHLLHVAPAPFEHAGVDVAQRPALHLVHAQQRPQVREAHPVAADDADDDPVARRDALRPGADGGRQQRGGAGAGRGRGGIGEKAAACDWHGNSFCGHILSGIDWRGCVCPDSDRTSRWGHRAPARNGGARSGVGPGAGGRRPRREHRQVVRQPGAVRMRHHRRHDRLAEVVEPVGVMRPRSGAGVRSRRTATPAGLSASVTPSL